MEKKAYIAPTINVHGLMIESAILRISGGQTEQVPNNLLNAGGIRMGTQTALSKGGFGSIFDDEDYDEFEDDF